MSAGRVGRRQHRGAAFQRSHHAAFGDAYALLLHSLQQRVLLGAYLVQLVDAADTLVGQNQCAGFDAQLTAAFIW